MSTIAGIAILGAGLFAKLAYLPALAALGDSAPALRAIYSRSEKSARELAESATEIVKLPAAPDIYHDGDIAANLDALLSRSDIEAVIIVLPISILPSVVLKCLAAGKHVLSEKPVAPDVAQGLELIKTVNAKYKPKGLVWRVAENYEAEPAVVAAGKAVRDGKIGDVIFFRTVVVNHLDQSSMWYKTPWRTVPDYQGGFLLDGGVHSAAVVRAVLQEPLTHLSGFASLNKDYLKPFDTINSVVKAKTFHGIFELTFAAPTEEKPAVDSLVVTGTKGWLSLNPTTIPGSKTPIIKVIIKSAAPTEGEPGRVVEEIIEAPSRGVEAEFGSFFEAIKGDDDGLGDPLGALRDVALIQASLNSKGDLVDLLQLVPAAL